MFCSFKSAAIVLGVWMFCIRIFFITFEIFYNLETMDKNWMIYSDIHDLLPLATTGKALIKFNHIIEISTLILKTAFVNFSQKYKKDKWVWHTNRTVTPLCLKLLF